MTKTGHTLAVLFTLIAATSGSAQPTGRTAPPAPEAQGIGLSLHAFSSEIGKSNFKSGNTKYNEASSTEFAFGLSQEIPVGPESEFQTSLDYRRTTLKFGDGKNAALPLPKHLESLGLGFNYSQTCNRDWSAAFGTSLISSRAGSGGFKSKGLGVEVLAAATYRSGPTLSFTGGAAYSSLARGTTRFFPLLGVNWTPGPQWTVALGLPETGVIYHFSDSFSLGLVAAGQGGAYYVETDPLPGAGDKPNVSRTTLDYFAFGTALKAEWRARPGFGVSASIGTILGREFEYESRKLKLKSDGGSLYCELGLNLAL